MTTLGGTVYSLARRTCEVNIDVIESFLQNRSYQTGAQYEGFSSM